MLRSALRGMPTPEARAALVARWLVTNGHADYPMALLSPRHNILSTDPPARVITDQLEAAFPLMSLKDLETSLEVLIDSGQRQRDGVVLTPDAIIDYLVSTACSVSVSETGQVPRICDPACGYGGFLVRAAQHLEREYDVTPRDAIAGHLTGYELNESSAEIARVMLRLYLLDAGHEPAETEPQVYVRDSLLDDGTVPGTTPPGVFDVLVTNPPYVKYQNMSEEYRARLVARYSEFTSRSFSTAMLFLIAGYRMLSPNGCLGYITQNNIFTSLAAKRVREYLAATESLHRIIDFGHTKVFGNASAYTCLLFLSPQRSATFEYGRIGGDVHARSFASANLSTISHASLDPSKWRLVPSEHAGNIVRLTEHGVPLSSSCDIRVGFATLKDRAYFVHHDETGVLAVSPEGDLHEIELEITRPAIRIADFGTEEEVRNNKRRIIFPYERVTGRYVAIDEVAMRKEFPRCYEHLQSWKPELASRDKGKRPVSPWYAWGRTQSMDSPGPKLLTKTFSDRPNFIMDESDSLFCNGYALFPKTGNMPLFEDEYPLPVIMAVLNSPVMDYYLRLTSFQIEGGYQCYQKNFIERFRLPMLTPDDQSRLLEMSVRERRDFLICAYGLEPSAMEQSGV